MKGRSVLAIYLFGLVSAANLSILYRILTCINCILCNFINHNFPIKMHVHISDANISGTSNSMLRLCFIIIVIHII